jgi:hypothetical protein
MRTKELNIRSIVLFSMMISIVLISCCEILSSFKTVKLHVPIQAEFIQLQEGDNETVEFLNKEIADEADEEVDEEDEVVIDNEFSFDIRFIDQSKLIIYFSQNNSSIEFVNKIEFPPEVSLKV